MDGKEGQHLHDDGTGPYCHSDETVNVPDCARVPHHYIAHDACVASAVDCAVPHTHYGPVLKDEDGNDLTMLSFNSNAPQTVYLHTLVDLDHGLDTRLLRIIVQDTLRPHVNTDEQAQLQPPLRGVN